MLTRETAENSINKENKSKTYIMTSAALMTAALCIIAPLSIPVGPVPISLATFVIYLSVFILGTKRALISCALYIVIGAIGLPVFTGFSGGIGKMMGPTGGYIIGYLFMILVSGLLLERLPAKAGGFSKKLVQVLCLAAGTLVLYLFGLIWFCKVSGMTAGPSLALTVYPFIPLDICKIIIAVIIGPVIADRIRFTAE